MGTRVLRVIKLVRVITLLTNYDPTTRTIAMA